MAGLGDFINSIQNDSDFPEDQRPISRWHFEVAHQLMKACLTSGRPAAARCAILHRPRLELRRRLRALVRVTTTVSIVRFFQIRNPEIPAKKTSNARSPRALALFRIFSALHRTPLSSCANSGCSRRRLIWTPLFLRFSRSGFLSTSPLLRGALLHHAPRRLLVGAGPVGWRPQCPADDDKPSRSLVAATGSHGGIHGRGAGPAGSHRRTDRVAVARNLPRR